MTALEIYVLRAEIGTLNARLGRLEHVLVTVGGDGRALRDLSNTVRDLLVSERDADRRLREKCITVLQAVISAYTREEGPSRGLVALTLAGFATVLLVAGTVTIADFQPLVSWWTGHTPAPAIQEAP